MLRNTATSYGPVSIVLHWLMAAAIFFMFALGLWMTDLNYYDRWYHDAPEIHKSIGMLLLFVLLFRLTWRLTNPHPKMMGAHWERLAGLVVHRLHYVLMFIVLVTGYLIPTAEGVGINLFGWFTVPATLNFDREQADLVGDIHRISAWMLMGLAGLHSAAALKHHWIDRDNTLLCMLGINKKNSGGNR